MGIGLGDWIVRKFYWK